MKSALFLIVFASIFSFTQSYAQVRGQDGPKLGIGADFAFPQGSYGDRADFGAGVSLLYQHPVSARLNITGNVGYLRFTGEGTYVNLKFKEGFVPIKAGARYFVSENIYGAGEVGVVFSTANGSGSGTAFVYTPGLGVVFPVSDSGNIDLGARYERWTRSNGTISLIGIRAGYNF